MSEKNRFLLIGELSKISGVGVKALKYYEKIGILKPIFVDPDSLYRYYSYKQLYFVELIHFCVELGIPLKEVNQYIDEEEKIDYRSLLTYGKEITKQRMSQLQKGMDFIEIFERELEKSESYGSNQEFYTLTYPEKTFYTIPCEDQLSREDMEVLLIKTLKKLNVSSWQGLELFEHGVLRTYDQDEMKSYFFIELTSNYHISNCNQTLKIPGGSYLCLLNDNSLINQAPDLFKDLFQVQEEVVVIETEVYANNQNFDQLKKELRIKLNDL